MDQISPQRVTLTLNELTTEGWSRFGTLPGDEESAARSDLEFLWNDGNVNFIAHDVGELHFAGNGRARCELLNRHDTHTQTLMPMNTDAYIVVAPASIDFSEPEHFAQVRAFRVPQHVPVHLARGTWHWGPYPIGADTVRIFNIQGRGYVNDNGIVWLRRDHHTTYEVAINE
jgi:Ureidoglycolate lyase